MLKRGGARFRGRWICNKLSSELEMSIRILIYNILRFKSFHMSYNMLYFHRYFCFKLRLSILCSQNPAPVPAPDPVKIVDPAPAPAYFRLRSFTALDGTHTPKGSLMTPLRTLKKRINVLKILSTTTWGQQMVTVTTSFKFFNHSFHPPAGTAEITSRDYCLCMLIGSTLVSSLSCAIVVFE